MTNLTNKEYTDFLHETIEGESKNMAVVDYLGFYVEHTRVTKNTDPRVRFGTRCKQHVEVYGFKVVSSNY